METTKKPVDGDSLLFASRLVRQVFGGTHWGHDLTFTGKELRPKPECATAIDEEGGVRVNAP